MTAPVASSIRIHRDHYQRMSDPAKGELRSWMALHGLDENVVTSEGLTIGSDQVLCEVYLLNEAGAKYIDPDTRTAAKASRNIDLVAPLPERVKQELP